MSRKAVVTGGAGFIGSHLVDALIECSFDVHVVDSYAAGKRADRISAKATYREVDVRDEKLASVLDGAQYVFHLAALPSVPYSLEHPLETFEVNAGATINVLRAAQRAGVKRVVLASSAAVYGDSQELPLREDAFPNPKSPYGFQKQVSELACRYWSEQEGLSTVSLRYFNVYGPRFDPEGAYALVVGRFLKRRMEGKPLTISGDGTHTRDYVHVRDIARANVLAAESAAVGKGELINVGTGRESSVLHVAALIGGELEYVEERVEPARSAADIRRAKALLGWKPSIKLEDGIADLEKSLKIA
jgi:UDP-glucose 4-epimerase